MSRDLYLIFTAKDLRTFVFGLVSVLLMASSGAALELSGSLYVIALALFLSSMSTTGTEAGPFQSVEVSVVPRLARRPGRALGPITCWAPAPPPVGQAGPLIDGRAHQAGLHG